ncbi:hypothetical protein MARPO_0135s0004 [Marchantia polymorpha]|uniref:PDZ domain-containing protein n=1 Tax=Marchantia polymorpha TaxID=3197 RepID=A0A2R6W782_MARPO|nr:hypothetical protein MARPO_0135s0004 [Marchantia polymorpha]|eukprot:PTQ29718.1 hypothetical protein MARPO_0135s0004 [Marchantia polymorpha]
MPLAFEIRFKCCFPAPPPSAILPSHSGLRAGWASRGELLIISRNSKGRRLGVVVVSSIHCRNSEQSKPAQELLSKAAKQFGQAVVAGSLLGLCLLPLGAEPGHACWNGYSTGEGNHGELENYTHPQHMSSALDNVGESERVPTAKSADRGMPHLNYLLGKPANARIRRWSSSHSGLRMFSAKREYVHEGAGDSLGVTYGQILQGRDDTTKRESMFTEDAWVGMTKLRQYDELLDKVEAEEKLCPECTKNRRLLEQVWQTVSNEYYDQYGSFSQSAWAGKLYDSLSTTGGLLRTKKETYRVIKNMVDSIGDRYSAFLNPQQYRLAIRRPIPSEIKYLTYQYTGVGVALGKKSPSGGLTIVSPFAGSPAEEAGILPGERLLRVDGEPVDSLSAEEAVNRLRGPAGSSVELEVTGLQPGNSVRKVVLERRALPLPPLRTRLVDAGDGRVLEYMRLHYFTHEGTKEMAAAIRQGEALGVDGYILDLRNNPGGVFEEAVAMAALWLDCQGCDVTETVRSSVGGVEDLVYSVNNLPKEIFIKHPGTLTHAPLAIITNRSSASASEVLTGALHDNHRAVVVGEKTFGKGVVQYFFPMDDGSGLKLTVEKYLTPARYDISKQGGLQPDRSCTDFPRQSGQSDVCIDEALEMLREVQEQQTVTRPSAEERLPYRWRPLNERSLLADGTY